MNKNRILMVVGGVVVALLLLAVGGGLLYRKCGPHDCKASVGLTHVTGGLAPLPAPGAVAAHRSSIPPLVPAAPAAEAPPASTAVVAFAPVPASGLIPVAAAASKPLPEPGAPAGQVDLGTSVTTARVEEKAQPVVHGAQASSAPAPSESSGSRATVFDTIDQINTDNALLNAEIAHARLKKTLTDIQAGRDPNAAQPQSAPFTGVPSAGVPATGGAAAANSGRGAYVEQVTTSPLINGGAPTADVVLASGGHVPGKAGSRIPGVGVIESVSIHSVMVNDGKRLFALPFGSDDASAAGGH